MTTASLALPRFDDAEVVVPAPGRGAGNWAGAASAVLVDDTFYLTYRVRRPLAEGRGVTTVVSRSLDGVGFEPVCVVHRDDFGAESFERPVVLRTPDGGWRLYLSCATPDSKHWWIEALDADLPEDLPYGGRTLVLPGDSRIAVKDPVITIGPDGAWHMWVCEHPLDLSGHEDRMSTAYYSSADGLSWTRHGTVLGPRPDQWDARGARVTTVLSLDPLEVLYDGRPTAAENWHEQCGLATGTPAESSVGPSAILVSRTDDPWRSPHSDGAWRYASVVPLADGTSRYYAEVARPDGAHDLVTGLI